MAMILDKTAQDRSLDVHHVTVTRSVIGVADGKEGVQSRIWEAKRMGQVATVSGSNLRTQVLTGRFGTLEVDPDLVLTFPDGLIGFERCRRYIVVRQDDRGVFRWLQSLEEPGVAFPIIEAGEFFSCYTPTISDGDAHLLELTSEVPTLLFAVVTVPRSNPHEMTANLLAPLVINGLTRCGKQVIIQNEGYTTRHRVMDELTRNRKLKVA